MGSGGDGSNNSANNNLSQFSDKLPSNDDAQQAINPNNVMNDLAQKVQNVADQTTQNSNNDQNNLSPIGKIFSLPSDTNKAPADNNTANAGPTPFFLQQQENAKKEAEAKTATSTTPAIIPIPALPKEEGLPALPQLPLPQ